MNRSDEVRIAAGYAAESYAALLESVDSGPVAPTASFEDLDREIAGSIAESGVGVVRAVKGLADLVARGSIGINNPMYMGLLNNSPLPAAPLADLLVSATNNNSGARTQGPAAFSAEKEILRAFSRLCLGHERGSGMLLPGGSFANLQALVVARALHCQAWECEGPTSLPGAPKVYVSASSHFSVARGAQVAGLGRNGVVSVPVTGRGSMDVGELVCSIESDLASGAAPFAVVATAGTTGTGAVDPLAEIADVCRRFRLWMHVDACYGAAAMLVPELRPRLVGMEAADSVAVDPHKWFFMPLTTSLLLLQDGSVELPTFDQHASYISDQSEDDGFRRGIPTSRRASSLTLWTTLRAHGWSTIRDAVRRNVAMARRLEGAFAERGFEVMPDGEMSIACVRWVGDAASIAEMDRRQTLIRDRAVQTGRTWFGTVRHHGKTWLCFRITNLYTEPEHVDAVVELVHETALDLGKMKPAFAFVP